MRKTRWWLRIVGGFYLALVVMNVVFITSNQDAIRDTIPFALDDAGLHAFIDAWFTFILAIAALGIVMLYASTKPHQSGMLVLAVVAGELLYGIGGDMWLISRGYSAEAYIPFSILHFVIAVIGVLLLRGELADPVAEVQRASAPARA